MFALAAVMQVTLAAAPVQIAASADTPERPWLLWTGLSSAVRTGSAAMGEGWVGISRALDAHWRPELDLGLGYAGAPDELLTSMRLGMNLELPLGRAVPFLWLAFAHNHESLFVDAKKDPLPAVLGLSENGVEHRTGAELGGGLRFDFGGERPGDPRVSLGLRANATALLGDGPAAELGGLAYVGIVI